jgi:hypothetical protein
MVQALTRLKYITGTSDSGLSNTATPQEALKALAYSLAQTVSKH